MTAVALDLATPRWALPLLGPARYKGAKGGRSSGKSHFFAERVVEECVCDPDLRVVCVREVQRSLKFSAKSLIERKIEALEVGHLFVVMTSEIRRVGGEGVIIFEGMQDHTADSLKSLEGFRRAWVEEAQSLSKRSLELLIPTIRGTFGRDDTEIWFSWNPEEPDDPVEEFMVRNPPDSAAVVHVNYLDNPFCPETSKEQAARMRRIDDGAYQHIWLGGYNQKSEAKVFAGKYRIEEFEPGKHWDGPYHGCDFGFAQSPTALIKCWISDRRLYIERESYQVKLDLHDTAGRWERDVPGYADYVVRGDCARPESISYLQQHGVPKIEGAPKWQGSVEDGIAFLRQFETIVIHPRCENMIDEARLYSYKVDKRTGDILPQIVDEHNHLWDSLRYALAPLIKQPNSVWFM